MLALLATSLCAACVPDSAFLYAWDHRRVVCSEPVDDVTQGDASDFIDDTFRLAANRDQVVTLHAHIPGQTITTGWLEAMLKRADADQLAYVTYSDLATGTPRPGLALAFDDQAIDAWYGIRDQLARHAAHVTFFVTRWQTAWDDAGRAKLRELVALGHDVQPHSVSHIHARAYVAEHGLPAYITDEVVPSIEAMRQAGYPPTTFAFPFGETSPEITDAVLQHIDRVRVSPGSCPY